jgi:hypothetical protein
MTVARTRTVIVTDPNQIWSRARTTAVNLGIARAGLPAEMTREVHTCGGGGARGDEERRWRGGSRANNDMMEGEKRGSDI